MTNVMLDVHTAPLTSWTCGVKSSAGHGRRQREIKRSFMHGCAHGGLCLHRQHKANKYENKDCVRRTRLRRKVPLSRDSHTR